MLSFTEYEYHHHHTSPTTAGTPSSTTSLAATLTPGTPIALDELKTLSLNSANLTSLQSSASSLLPLAGPPSSTSTAASESSSDSSLLSSVGMGAEEDDLVEEEEYDIVEYDDDDAYNSHTRHQRAKEAAKILLSQCLLEDNPRYYSDSLFSKTSRLGLAPVTLLLNPETPCPTKIIPLPDTSSTSSAYSLDDDDGPSSSSEEEQEAQDVQEAQAASLFIRLL